MSNFLTIFVKSKYQEETSRGEKTGAVKSKLLIAMWHNSIDIAFSGIWGQEKVMLL